MTNKSTTDQDSAYWLNPKNYLHILQKLLISFIRDGLSKTEHKQPNNEKPLENLSILDISCGGGIVTESLAKLGGKMVGLDSRAEVIKVAKNHAALDATLKNITYLNEELDEYSEKNREKYDVVIASEAMEYDFNPVTYLNWSVACLKPGGSIFITTKNQTVPSFIDIIIHEQILGIVPKGSQDHGRYLSPGRVTEILEKHNCSVKEIRGMKYSMFCGTMQWCDSTSKFYALHAVKNK